MLVVLGHGCPGEVHGPGENRKLVGRVACRELPKVRRVEHSAGVEIEDGEHDSTSRRTVNKLITSVREKPYIRVNLR